MEILYKTNSRVLWLAVLGIIMVCSSYLTFAYNPLQIAIKLFVALKPGSIFYNLWSVPPYEVLVKVTIFNVTNSEEFLSGKDPKLNLSEVGPYFYREILTNENATFKPDGSITFYPRRKIEFDPVRSIGDPSVDRIISPNIPLLGIQAYLNDASFFTNLAFSSFSSSVRAKSFLNLTIDEYLWGYDDKLVELANQFLPNWIDFEKFGILDRLMTVDNGNVVTISASPELDQHPHELLTTEERMNQYHIIDWNGSPGLKEWGWVDPVGNETVEGNKRCQMVAGSFEGTILPSFMPENVTYKIFRKAFCRPVPLVYEGRGIEKYGFDVYNYRISETFLETPEVNPDNKCFCVKDRCLPKGLGHLSPCYYGIPITMSPPHFFQSDPMLLEQVNGLKPNVTLHDSVAQVHPIFGIPLDGHLRIQINMDVGETKINSRTKPFNNLHIPLFWLELTVADVPNIVYYTITWTCHVLPIVQVVLMYLLGLLGLALVSTSALLCLFFNTPQKMTGRLSFSKEYSAIPTIITLPQQYFKSDLRISK